MIFNPDDTHPDIHRFTLSMVSARSGTITGTVSRDKSAIDAGGKFGNVTEFGDPIPIVNIVCLKLLDTHSDVAIRRKGCPRICQVRKFRGKSCIGRTKAAILAPTAPIETNQAPNRKIGIDAMALLARQALSSR
jgi:hypothetical protein